MKSFTLIFVVAASLSAAACSPFNPDLDDAPYLCTATSMVCPEGYSCQSTGQAPPKDLVCLKDGGTLPDAGSGSGFTCADQAAFEPNDTIQMATQTDTGTVGMRSFGPISICPENDKDHFAINTTVLNQGIEAITTWESGDPVNVSILNNGGATINNGVAMGTTAMRACVANLPIGTYYVSAFAGTGIKNNYRLALKIVPNC